MGQTSLQLQSLLWFVFFKRAQFWMLIYSIYVVVCIWWYVSDDEYHRVGWAQVRRYLGEGTRFHCHIAILGV